MQHDGCVSLAVTAIEALKEKPYSESTLPNFVEASGGRCWRLEGSGRETRRWHVSIQRIAARTRQLADQEDLRPQREQEACATVRPYSAIVILSRSQAGHCQDSQRNSSPSANWNPGSNTFPNGLMPNCRSRMQRHAEPSGCTLIWSTPPEHNTVMGTSGFTTRNPVFRLSHVHGSRKACSDAEYSYGYYAIDEWGSTWNRKPWDRNISAQAVIKYICSDQATMFTVTLKPWFCRKRQRPTKISGFIGCVCVPSSMGWKLVAPEVNYTSVENGTLTARASVAHSRRFLQGPIPPRSDRPQMHFGLLSF